MVTSVYMQVIKLTNEEDCDHRLQRSLDSNLKSAALCGLLLIADEQCTEEELYCSIASLSYQGLYVHGRGILLGLVVRMYFWFPHAWCALCGPSIESKAHQHSKLRCALDSRWTGHEVHTMWKPTYLLTLASNSYNYSGPPQCRLPEMPKKKNQDIFLRPIMH